MRVGGVITNDPTQRISLQSWRFVLATAGGMLSTVLMMPLVKLIGGENKALGFRGYRGALGGGVPDAGVLLLYHQRAR
ncbi:MFS transporter [Salmonella enterica subsp. enterica serovar Typhimurium]|nr:MFS transporter [Salmonella enterica subsp. enterica serovar Typhimurium]